MRRRVEGSILRRHSISVTLAATLAFAGVATASAPATPVPDLTWGPYGDATSSVDFNAYFDGEADDELVDSVVGPDGSMYLAGSALVGQTGAVRGVLAKLRADGHLDEQGFGVGGRAFTPMFTATSAFRARAVAMRGDILYLSGTYTEGNQSQFALCAFGVDGQPRLFGATGSQCLLDKVVDDHFNAFPDVAIQPDGKIVLAGEGGVFVGLLRYEPDGELDDSFGPDHDGRATGDVSMSRPSLAMGSNGKLVVVGSEIVGDATRIRIARFDSTGAQDGFVGTPSCTVSIPGTYAASARSVLLKPSGSVNDRIVVAGYVWKQNGPNTSTAALLASIDGNQCSFGGEFAPQGYFELGYDLGIREISAFDYRPGVGYTLLMSQEVSGFGAASSLWSYADQSLGLIGATGLNTEAGGAVVATPDAIFVGGWRQDEVQPAYYEFGAMKFGGIDRIFADGADAP